MAPKKLIAFPPLEDDQKPSTKKQTEDKLVVEEDDSSEEQGSSSEEEEEEKDQSQSASETPPPSTPITNPKPSSESESGSDSGSESDTEPEPTPPPNSNVKPLDSKPMKAQSKTHAQTTSVPARSGTKRAAENRNDSNRSKKKTTAAAVTTVVVSDDENETEEKVKLTGEDSKKSNQRIFGNEDELTILKGLADFISKTGKDPLKDATAFHSFVKKSLCAEANSKQLNRRVRTLKKKFESSDIFTKPHDKKAFELFKKVWGNTGANGEVNRRKTRQGVTKEAPASAKKEAVKVESVVDNSLILSELFRFFDDAGAGGLSVMSKDAVKRGLELIEESRRVEFEERWNRVKIAKLELLVRLSQLVKDQSELLLQELKKSSK